MTAMPARNVAVLAIAALLIALPPAASALADNAADAAPLTLDDIRDMRRARISHDKIVEAAQQRGLAFELDKLAESRLRGLGFKPDQIDRMRKPAPDPAAPPDAAPKPAEPDPLAEKARAEAKLGPRMPAFWHNRVDALIRQINRDANVTVTTVTADHITLSAPKVLANKFLGDIQKLETLIKAKFPAPLNAGPDKRSAHIVLLQTRYEYVNWVRTMFEVYKTKGITVDGQDPMGMLLRTNGFLMPTHCVLCLEAAPQEDDQRHRVAYYVGHMWMNHITESRAPDAVVTGFGNYAETLLLGDPRVMVYSYEERNIAGNGQQWAAIIANRVRTGDIATIPKVFKHSTVDMKQEHYAEGWSLVSVLAEAPEQFAKVVELIRDLRTATTAVEEAFGKTLEQVTEAWYKFAGKR